MAADRKRIRAIALGGVLAALGTAILWLGSMLPGYAIPTAAVAGLVSAAAVLQSGIGTGAAVYGVTALLSLLLLPQKIPALWYLVLFGHYGVVKSMAERLPGRILEWCAKLAVYTCAFFVLKYLLSDAFAALTALLPITMLPLFFVGLAVFVCYDIGFSRLIGLYLRRMGRNSGKGV